MVQTIIIDSDPSHRAMMRRLLGAMPSVAIVAEYASMADGLVEAPSRRPDVLIVEVQDAHDAASLERLAKAVPNAAVLAMGPVESADFVMQVMRAGALEILRRPVERPDLMAALDKVARVRQSTAPKRHLGPMTSVFSAKGGLGVTTVATNLAVCLAEGLSGGTLLMDMDTAGQSDITTFLDVTCAYSVLDAFENLDRLDEAFLRGLVTRYAGKLWLLPGPCGRRRLHLTAGQVQAGLDAIRSHFDHVILDLRHDVDVATLAAMEASDSVLFLTSLNVAALRTGATALALMKQNGVALQKVKVVVMREETGEEVTLKQAEDTLGIPVFWRTPNDYAIVVSSINHGQPVVTASPRSRIAKNLTELAEALSRRSGAGSAEPSTGLATSLLRYVWNPRGAQGGG